MSAVGAHIRVTHRRGARKEEEEATVTRAGAAQ